MKKQKEIQHSQMTNFFCPTGMHVTKHCTEFTGTSCAPCREGSYQDHDNGREQCFLCKKCDAGTF